MSAIDDRRGAAELAEFRHEAVTRAMRVTPEELTEALQHVPHSVRAELRAALTAIGFEVEPDEPPVPAHVMQAAIAAYDAYVPDGLEKAVRAALKASGGDPR
jgi:hypothetical protein